MHHDSSNKAADVVLERYRRTRDRAVIIAVAACTLALGVVIGVVFSATKRPAIARDGEAAVEMSSAFVEIARKVEPAVVNISTVSQPAISISNFFH